MAGQINDEDIQTLKERLDIVDVIQPYTALKRSGGGYMGRCPFHDEKSPSFSVQPRGFYHCFGCGVGGDAIKFVQEIEGLSFAEAVEKLARQFGVTLRYAELRPGQKAALGRRTRLIELVASAKDFFAAALRSDAGADARRYLTDRGVEPGAWEVFGLGWAPDAWGDLSDHLVRKGASTEDLVKAGLATQGKRGPVDRFRARVIFPIRDARGGDTVAFGGRILPGGPTVTKMDGNTPKYINSPTTEVYDKSTTLYGLDLARREIVKRQEALIVEGYMDVIALHRAGHPNTVAPCGTALTEQHFTLLQRMDARVTLALDADDAGYDAAERARERAETAELTDLGVLVLPAGKDPADLVAAGGAEAVAAVLAERKTALEFQIEHLLRSADLSTPEAKTAAYRSTFPLMGALSDHALRYHYVHNIVAPAVGIPGQRIEDELQSAFPTHQPASSGRAPARQSRTHTASAPRNPQAQVEREVLQVALQVPDALPEDFGLLDPSVFTSAPSTMLFEAIVSTGYSNSGVKLESVLEVMPDDDMRSRVMALAASELTVSTTPEAVRSLVDWLRAEDVSRRLSEVRRQLEEGGEHLDGETRRALMAEMGELDRLRRHYTRRDGAGDGVM